MCDTSSELVIWQWKRKVKNTRARARVCVLIGQDDVQQSVLFDQKKKNNNKKWCSFLTLCVFLFLFQDVDSPFRLIFCVCLCGHLTVGVSL